MNDTNEVIIDDIAPSEAAVAEVEGDIPTDVEMPEEAPSADDIGALKEELETLKFQLEQSRAMYDKFHAECLEFSSLYPDVPLSSIPDKIWESTRAGIPLAAAYALSEKKESVAKAKAININSKNNERSSGALNSSGSEEYFSPAEVKAMSAAEVRANYAKIITSMSKWH